MINLKVYPFDKGSGFAIIKEDEVIERIQEKIGKSTIVDYDPTSTLLKLRKELVTLRIEGTFYN